MSRLNITARTKVRSRIMTVLSRILNILYELIYFSKILYSSYISNILLFSFLQKPVIRDRGKADCPMNAVRCCSRPCTTSLKGNFNEVNLSDMMVLLIE